MKGRFILALWWIPSIFLVCPLNSINAQDAQALVEESFNYMRGKTSVSTVSMTIHRTDWERVMTIKAWTKGEDESIFWITAPPKDYGNATLKKGEQMWIYNPKVNRVIKIPPSMMSQAWMGSDFSNNDISKTDSLLRDYEHTILGTETHEGKKVFVVKSMPKPQAPVIWGMQKLRIREDLIFLSQEFYDEALQLVKAMTTLEIQVMGGKLFPRVWKMQKADAQDEYTLLEYRDLAFDKELPEGLFTISSLKRLRR
ncbi:MAG: outer membrane lipoprotein-sorting protein [Deltaproteobacteria bacterium]|nr:outer membrane lipoprotein-sorting protein [Deltaproteobacteria bacterium]MBW2078511.1 outer membrane lipoprotein-sorting protein [Deltaproteobacteria bacterium]MBW2310612.1 outer membrane lipoprotein-sorting protein [Deltaproteobacteria bacterium]RLB28825.1 MAG: outer membrane lipoprotein-sorting protein [Deltaproteobacteria bacterium]